MIRYKVQTVNNWCSIIILCGNEEINTIQKIKILPVQMRVPKNRNTRYEEKTKSQVLRLINLKTVHVITNK